MADVNALFQEFKKERLGAHVDIDGWYGAQCVDVANAWALKCFPGTTWPQVMPPVQSAKDLGAKHAATYFDWIENDHNDVNQLPQVGDIIVCGATPAPGYQNKFNNPDGHTGVCESADKGGYTMIQQDGSHPEGSAFMARTEWRWRPVLGWLRPKLGQPAAPAPAAPAPAGAPGNTVFLPGHVQSWAAYKVGSGLRKGTSDQVATLSPAKYGGLRYNIVSRRTNSVVIDTQMFGRVEIWVKDTDAQIS